MKSLPSTLSFVDVETTGSNPRSDRIIEIGIIRVEDNKVVKKFNTLLNPQGAYLPPFISDMTGITPAELSTAPYFEEVKSQVTDLLSDSVFVAHNVNFDYGFVKHELKRLESQFKTKTLCTVRLSRYLFPEHRKHNLDILKQRFGLTINNRHRAYDDALALWEFYKKAIQQTKEQVFFDAVKAQLTYAVPKNLQKQDIDNLHDGPGVYIFYGSSLQEPSNSRHPGLDPGSTAKQQSPLVQILDSRLRGNDDVVLYVGKSVNVRKRVMNHFSSAKFSQKEDRMFNEITRIEVLKTHGELGALIRESSLIKELSPVFNAALRRKTEMSALTREEKNGYFAARLTKINNLGQDNIKFILGVYKSKKQTTEILRDFAKNHKLCPKLLGLEKYDNKYCFNTQLDLCNGACKQDEDTLKYNLRFLESFSSMLVPDWPFDSEVYIREESDEGAEIHKVDNWIYKGSVLFTKEDNELPGLSPEVFDWDVFKIIKKAVRRNRVTKADSLEQKALF